MWHGSCRTLMLKSWWTDLAHCLARKVKRWRTVSSAAPGRGMPTHLSMMFYQPRKQGYAQYTQREARHKCKSPENSHSVITEARMSLNVPKWIKCIPDLMHSPHVKPATAHTCDYCRLHCNREGFAIACNQAPPSSSSDPCCPEWRQGFDSTKLNPSCRHKSWLESGTPDTCRISTDILERIQQPCA